MSEPIENETAAPARELEPAKSEPAKREPPRTDDGRFDTVRMRPVSVVPAKVRAMFERLPATLREWLADPDFSIFFVVFMITAALLFLRWPSGIGGGFIFDEQEAILANPYVRGKQPWLDAFRRDFWGLLPERSIGSYRPIPNFLWRALWRIQEWRSKGTGGALNTPFVWFNIVFHATNAALLATLVRGALRRVGTAWIAGAAFCACAILTEAVSGIVGIADVLGGLSILLAIAALTLHPLAIGPAVFAATLFGLLSKESAVVNVGLVPLVALALSPAIDEERPRPWLRAIASLVGASLALALYFKIRHDYFHIAFTLDPEKMKGGLVSRLGEQLRVYVGAPNLPVDPFNNPLAEPSATTGQRIGGALRVYFRGFVQVIVPNRLSPDYSSPQEPLPARGLFPESILGALLLVGPPLVGLATILKNRRRKDLPSIEQNLFAYALVSWPAAFFPISNIPKALPTVRAERFWYTPTLAIAVGVAVLFLWLAKRRFAVAAALCAVFLVIQGVQTRRHANDFRDDLAFWQSAAKAVPNSAKAHLNYSVMLGARAAEIWKYTTQQAQEARLVENIRATELAPKWDMAFIYVGDTLCQLNRMDEAWEWYVKGFRIGPANTGLIALGLQCLSDHNHLLAKEKEARALVEEPGMSGSWLAYLVNDTLERERKCRGVDVPAPVVEDPPPLFDTPEEDPPTEGASASGSASASVSATKGEAEAKAKGKGSTKSSASTSASTSASVAAAPSASVAPPPPKPLPPCGVDSKYRPRGLDGDPKGD